MLQYIGAVSEIDGFTPARRAPFLGKEPSFPSGPLSEAARLVEHSLSNLKAAYPTSYRVLESFDLRWHQTL